MSSRSLLLRSIVLGVLVTSKTSLPAEADADVVSPSTGDDFECIPPNSGETRFATKPIPPSTTQIAPPLLIWESPEFSDSGYTPERRCKEVTSRLKAAVADVGGNPANLQLTIGTVNELSVICHVNQLEESCNSRNVIFTLSKKNRAKPAHVMAAMLKFSVTGTGTSLVE